MNPCFFVENNLSRRQMTPVLAFARNREIALKDGEVSDNFDPMDCGIDWDKYHPILPIGPAAFLESLKQTELASYVLADTDRFKAQTWHAALGTLMFKTKRRAAQTDDDGNLVTPATTIASVPDRRVSLQWRCWIIGNRLIEVSQYQKDGERNLLRGAPSDVVEFVYKVLHTWTPEPCVTMDVAMTPEGLRVIEFQPIHSASWKAANATSVLLAWMKWMKRYCI